ncbi:MAG: LPS biosynthesis protein WbpP [Chloroflexi bacterium]|nr:LPS biosynthesis protein WbpP [Chloroflexota bacterium]
MSNRLETIQLELQENSYNWLVTGAAGFIGSHLVQFLLDNNQNVLAVDNFSTGLKKNIDFLNRYHQSLNNNSKFIFSESDIRDYDQCLLMTKGIDFVLHQAAIGSVPRSIKDPLTSHDSNINGFLNIIQSSKENKVQNLVYASSSSVYGDSEVLPKKESHQGNLLSPYALTKSVNESYAMVFSEAYDFNSIGLRYFNVFGLRQDPNGQYAAVIPRWINAIMKGEDFFINGDGSTTRDFCYINNAVQANIIAAIPRTNEALNRVYNIAANHQITLIELYKIISQNISMNLPSIEVNRPIFRDFRPGDILHSRADIELAEELLGYEVSMSVEDGLKDLIKLECEKYE